MVCKAVAQFLLKIIFLDSDVINKQHINLITETVYGNEQHSERYKAYIHIVKTKANSVQLPYLFYFYFITYSVWYQCSLFNLKSQLNFSFIQHSFWSVWALIPLRRKNLGRFALYICVIFLYELSLIKRTYNINQVIK